MPPVLNMKTTSLICLLGLVLLSDAFAQTVPPATPNTPPPAQSGKQNEDKETKKDAPLPSGPSNPLVKKKTAREEPPVEREIAEENDYRIEPRHLRTPRNEEEELQPFGFHFFDSPRQLIAARRNYFRRLYGQKIKNGQEMDESGNQDDKTSDRTDRETGKRTKTGTKQKSGDGKTTDRNRSTDTGSEQEETPPTQEELDAVLALTDAQKRDILSRAEEGTLSAEESKQYRLLLKKSPSRRSSETDRGKTKRNSKKGLDTLTADGRPEKKTASNPFRQVGDSGDDSSSDPRHGASPDAIRDIADPISQLFQNMNASAPANYQIAPGDTLVLRFSSKTLEEQELNLTVDPQGGITVPDVGRVILRGQTPAQAETALRLRMRDYYPGVVVSLSLKEMRTVTVTVSGEAYMPGVYVVPAATTAYNLLYATGGPGENGTWRRIELRRHGVLVATLDLYQFLISGKNTTDTAVQSGDILYVPGRFGQVAVRGNVRRKALYEVLDGETLQQALSYAGGILPTGITQRVQLHTSDLKGSRILKDVDLSEASHTRPVSIYDGDSIEVFSVRPLLTNKVTIEGAVDQPGEYALNETMTVADLVQRARGLLAEGYAVRADLNRVNPDLSLTLIPINLEKALAGNPAANLPLQRWDRLTVYTRDQIAWSARREVTVSGAIRKPGIYTRSDNMRIKDLLLQADGTLPEAAQLVLLHQKPDGTLSYQYPVLSDVMKGDPEQNLLLQDRDKLAIYRTDEARFTPNHKIEIQGEVVTPGIYPYGEGMRLSDALKLAGGLGPRAGSRIQVASARLGKDAAPTLVQYDPSRADVSPNLILNDGDVVIIQGRENYRDTPAVIHIEGAVNRPGPIFLTGRSMRLSDAIREAGGVSPEGYPEGAELVRNPTLLASSGQRQLATVISKTNDLLNKLEYRRELARSDIERMKAAGNASGGQTMLPVQIPGLSGGDPQTVANGAAAQQGAQTLFTHQLVSNPRELGGDDLEPLGKVAIDLSSALKKPGNDEDVVLMDGDTVSVPQRPTTIQVIGAVIHPRAIPFRMGLSLQHYIDQAGGYTTDSARDRGVVIRLGGGLMPMAKVRELRPGDVILIPTRVQAAHISDNRSQIDSIFRGLTNGSLIFLFAKKLLGL